MEEVQVATVSSSKEEILQLLNQSAQQCSKQGDRLGVEQQKDKELRDIIQFLVDGSLPDDNQVGKKIAMQASSFAVIEGILYFVDPKQNCRKRCTVPHHLRAQIMEENHSGMMAGYFSGEKLYKSLVTHWYWQGKYSDVMSYCMSCPQCAIVNAAGRVNKSLLQPIPVS